MSQSPPRKAIERLLRTVAPGDAVYTIVRHVSRRGMRREISLVAIDRSAVTSAADDIAGISREALTTIDYWAARALGYRMGKHGGIVVRGPGMDMGFHLVYQLGRTLWPNGTDNPHDGPHGGYALKHGWL